MERVQEACFAVADRFALLSLKKLKKAVQQKLPRSLRFAPCQLLKFLERRAVVELEKAQLG